MAKDALGQGFKRFEFRAGFNDFNWRGMQTEGEAGSNAPNRPRMLVNARIENGAIIERAGLLPPDFNDGTSCIRLTADFQLGTPKKLWLAMDGCPGISLGVGTTLASIDQEQSPEFQRCVYIPAATTSLAMGSFGKDLYIGVGDTLRRVIPLPVPYGVEGLGLSGSSQDKPIYTFTGFAITCLQEFDGKLFIGLDSGVPGTCKIATWDGLSIRDDLTGIQAPQSFGLYRVTNGGDAIVVGLPASNNSIAYRPAGASPGVWVPVAPAAGTVAGYSMVSYKDVLYIADRGANVWSFDGTTLAIARSPAGAIRMNSVATFNHLLYFAYDTATSVTVGKFDGTTWTDVESTLTANFTAGTTRINAIASYRGTLIAAGSKFWLSHGLDTTGNWIEISASQGVSGFASYLLVA